MKTKKAIEKLEEEILEEKDPEEIEKIAMEYMEEIY